MYLNVKEIKTVTENNIQIHIILITYDNKYEPKNRTPEINRLVNDSKDMRVEIAMNGHLENCVCRKCHEARAMLKALRLM